MDHSADSQPIAFDVADPFVIERTVVADDVDVLEHLNNAVVVQWMERAAYAHSCHVGYDQQAYEKLGATFVVRKHEIEYLVQAYEGDALLHATWPGSMERFTATRRHQIVRVSDGKTIVRAHTTWIFIDAKTSRPKRMPAQMIAALRPRQG